MSRLITFGCSHTYGEGQIDCLNSQGPNSIVMADKPSQYAWPAVLGRELNIEEVINLGRPGCSNRYIANRILDTTIEKDDIIVILWTEVNRSTVFTSESIQLAKVATNIHPTKNTKVSKSYYKWIHDPYNSFLESLEAVNLANYTLQEHRHVYNFKANFNSKLGYNKTDIEYVYPKWNKVNLINQSLYYVDFASDNDHPGPESQKLIARDMLKYVKET
tara:strand:+ start:227 stop:880 length:654 start_codon:yes stop_codon:yes gene_type:complete